MPKNATRLKQVVNDDPGAETTKDARADRAKDIVQPVKIIGITMNSTGSFFGLGDDGRIYRLTDGQTWETLQ